MKIKIIVAVILVLAAAAAISVAVNCIADTKTPLDGGVITAVKRPVEVQAIQVHPSAKSDDLKAFAPSIEYLGGIDFHSDDSRPTANASPFFCVLSREGRVCGDLYDWILKGDGGLVWINSEETFAENYRHTSIAAWPTAVPSQRLPSAPRPSSGLLGGTGARAVNPTTNLVETLRPRAQLIMEIVSNRFNDPRASDYNQFGRTYYGGGSWRGYKQSEKLNCTRPEEATVTCSRPANSNATITFFNIRPFGNGQIDYGPERVVDTQVQDHAINDIDLPAGATFDDTVSFTFSKTTSRVDSFKQGLEVAFSQQLRIGTEKTFAGAELKAEQRFTADFEQRYGNDETTSNTVSRHLTLTGPTHVRYSATRSVDQVQHEVDVALDYEHGVSINDHVQVNAAPGPSPNFWDTIVGWFQPPAVPPKRNRLSFQWASLAGFTATISDNGNEQDPLYNLFYQRPEVPDVVSLVQSPPGRAEIQYVFDRVTSQKIVVEQVEKKDE